MKYLLALALLSLAVTQQVPEENGVLILTDANWEYVLKKYEYILIDFYAHWCGHWYYMDLIIAITQLQYLPLLPDKFVLRMCNLQKYVDHQSKINCPEFEYLCRRFQVQSFPTLKLFQDGQLLLEYQGERTEKAIIDWMRKKTSNNITKIDKGSVEAKTLDQLKRFTDSSNFVIVFYGESKETFEFMEYFKFSSKNKQISAMHTFNQNYANEMRASVPSIVVYKPYDERKATISDNFEESFIEQFVKKHQYPVLMSFDIPVLLYENQTAKRIFRGNQPTLFLIQNSQTNSAEKHLRLALSKIKDQVLICIANTDNRYGERLMQYFGIQSGMEFSHLEYLPQVVAFNPKTDSFNLLSEITKDGIINFTQQFLGLQPQIQKQDL